MKTIIVVALCLLGLSALVDAKVVWCRILTNGTNECQLRPLNVTAPLNVTDPLNVTAPLNLTDPLNVTAPLNLTDPLRRCTAEDVTGGIRNDITFDDNETPLCVTTVTERENGSVTLYRGKANETGATTCAELCTKYVNKGGKLLYFGCVKKTDGDFINFGMRDTNENSEVLTYLPLNIKPYQCPEEVKPLPIEPYQSAAIGVVGAVIVSIVVGAIILYFGWIRSMPVSGSTTVQPSAPQAPVESSSF